MKKTLRVAVYGLGEMGKAIARLLLKKEGYTLVGAVDIDPKKAGHDLGKLLGLRQSLGIQVSRTFQEILPRHPDLVLHATTSLLSYASQQILECVDAGIHVISTCEELSFPFQKYPELTDELHRRAKAKGVCILGTGVNPGFVMDSLVLTLAGACQKVERVKVWRVVDAGQRRLPLQKKVGAGLVLKEFLQQVKEGEIKHHGLPESTALIAYGLGWKLEKIQENIQPVIARSPLTTPCLHIRKGQVRGVHQICTGFVDKKPRIQLKLQMFVGARKPRDEIHIEGTPPVRMKILGGIHGDLATPAILIHSIPFLLQALPGLYTPADLPIHFSHLIQPGGKPPKRTL